MSSMYGLEQKHFFNIFNIIFNISLTSFLIYFFVSVLCCVTMYVFSFVVKCYTHFNKKKKIIMHVNNVLYIELLPQHESGKVEG